MGIHELPSSYGLYVSHLTPSCPFGFMRFQVPLEEPIGAFNNLICLGVVWSVKDPPDSLILCPLLNHPSSKVILLDWRDWGHGK